MKSKISTFTLILCLLIFSTWGLTCKKLEKEEKIKNKNFIQLPKPDFKSTLSLEDVLSKRKAVRNFSQKNLTLKQISQLLWAACGKTASLDTTSGATRTAPSAGALEPVEIYLVTKSKIYRYEKNEHKLTIKKISKEDLRSTLSKASLYQKAVEEAPLTLLISGVYERTTVKYGERGKRYVLIEAGHIAQNILLEATSLNLGAVPMGAFNDSKVRKIFSLPSNTHPLYLISVGYPQK